MKIGPFQAIERLRKIEEPMLRGEPEHAQRTGDGQSFAPGRKYTFPIIHQMRCTHRSRAKMG